MTQEESLNDSERSQSTSFSWKSKTLKMKSARSQSSYSQGFINFTLFSSISLTFSVFFPLFSCAILFLLPAQCACSVALWESGFVIPVCSMGFVDLLGTAHPTDCTDMRTLSWYWHTAEISSPATTAGFQYGKFSEVAHHCSQDPFPLQLVVLGPSARLPEQEEGKEPPKKDRAQPLTLADQSPAALTKENQLITL